MTRTADWKPDALSSPLPWRIGEHIAVVGDTGTGKTFLVSKLVEARKYVVVIRTKPDDIKFPGFRKVRKAEAMDALYSDRLLLAPTYERQAFEAWHALERAWKHGNWTIVIDELWYVEQKLGLGKMVDRLLTQGRSKGLSVIVGMQRPAQISRFAISQCTHLFTFRVDGRDADTIKLATTPRIIPAVESLSGHDFAYYNRAKRIVTTGNAKQLDRILKIPRAAT